MCHTRQSTLLGTILIPVILGCASFFKEVIILLPAKIDGAHLILCETSASEVSIYSSSDDCRVIVPSRIDYIWWNDSIIVTQNQPMQKRNSYDSDTIKIPIKNSMCWYVIDITMETIDRISNVDDLEKKLSEYGVKISDITLWNLHQAQKIREKELGFRFTTSTVYDYIKQLNGKENETTLLKVKD